MIESIEPIDFHIVSHDGLIKFTNIDCDTEIWTQKGWCKAKILNKELTNIWRFTTNASIYYGAEDSLIVCNGRKVEINKCSSIDILQAIQPKTITKIPQLIMDGLVVGDGSAYKGSYILPYLNIGQKDQDYFDSEIKHLIIERQPSTHSLGWRIKTNITTDELPLLPVRPIPNRYLYGTINEICSFLMGLFSANGTGSGNRVSLKSTNYKLIRQSQIMLGLIGIRSYMTTTKPRKIKWSNGEYTSKESFDLNINEDRNVYFRLIGFIQKYKTKLISDKLRFGTTYGSKYSYEILKKELVGEIMWPKIKVDNKYNTFWANGLNVCGN